MNLGEKIQLLRKNAGLSQEELAEKIYVTRQSVSLWEQNKSQPSIDNVSMLCEVFKISADQLLGIGGKSIPFENKKPENRDVPQEEMPFATAHTSYNLYDLKKAYSFLHTKKWLKYLVIGLYLFLFGTRLLLLWDKNKPTDNIVFFIATSIGAFLICVFVYLKISDNRKAKAFIKAQKNRQDDFLFFIDHILIRTAVNETDFVENRIEYHKLKTVKAGASYIVFETETGIFYFFVNSVLGNINRILNICRNQALFYRSAHEKIINPPRNIRGKKIKSVRRNSTAMIITLCILFAASIVFVFVKNYNDILYQMNLIFIPIIFMFLSILYVIYGQYWKRRGVWIREALPVGIFMAFLFCFVATMYFPREIEYKSPENVKLTVSTDEYNLMLNTDLPDEGFLYKLESPQSEGDISCKEAKKIVFTEMSEVSEFEKSLPDSEVWKTSLNEFDTDFEYFDGLWQGCSCDYFDIYNSYEVDENGGEEKIFFGYDSENNALYICEFTEK